VRRSPGAESVSSADLALLNGTGDERGGGPAFTSARALAGYALSTPYGGDQRAHEGGNAADRAFREAMMRLANA
jgi:hypothetical protein